MGAELGDGRAEELADRAVAQSIFAGECNQLAVGRDRCECGLHRRDKRRRSMTDAGMALAILFLGVAGCKSVWDDVKSDVAGTAKVTHRNWTHAKDTIFRHLLNYDEDDPYL